MVLILSSGKRVNLKMVDLYFYGQAKLQLHLASGPTIEEPMDVNKAAKILVAIDKALDGPYYVNPPEKPKKNERSSTSRLDGNTAGGNQTDSPNQGMEKPG